MEWHSRSESAFNLSNYVTKGELKTKYKYLVAIVTKHFPQKKRQDL